MFEVYRKTSTGKQHFGYYHTEEAANKIIILLKKAKWDYNNLSNDAKKFFRDKGLNEFPIIKPKRRKRKKEGKYYTYHKSSDRYVVQKFVNGKTIKFATFKKESEAKEYVTFLKKHDWDTKYIKRNKPKFYTLQNGKYAVVKTINGKQEVFGRYEKEIEAKLAVEYFANHNWDITLKETHTPKFYAETQGRYVITKNINNTQVYFCTLYSEEDAKLVVDALIENNWDKDKLPDNIKKLFTQRRPQFGINYSYNSERDLYYIQKTGDKRKFIGYVKTEEDALKIIDELEDVGWDRNKLSDESKNRLVNNFRDEPKYYSITPEGNYRITKNVNGVNTYFGVYDTLEEVEHMVELLKHNNWDRNKLPREFKQYFRNKNYYFRKDINKYIITKKINGENKYFGAYQTEKEAEQMIIELNKVNWIIEDLPEEFKINKYEREKAKYYRYDEHAKKWRIYKTVDGKYTNFGYYDTEEEAQAMVKYLKENNWDRSLLDIGNFKYYKKYGDKYQIKKRLDGKMEYFGTYDTEEQAKEAVELLKQNKWNKECLI